MKQGNNVWSEPTIETILAKYGGGEPSIGPDGKFLFFRSMIDEEGNSQNNADIWWINRNDNNLNDPKKIGSTVNSKFNEAYPNFSSDGALYFRSNREGGEGGFDLYYSQFISGNFTNPQNLGKKVISKFQDATPVVSVQDMGL